MDQINIGEVAGYLTAFVDGFDFTRPGKDQSLGRDLAKKQVDRIIERSQQFVAPDGSSWPSNSTTPTPRHPQGYKQWKEDEYGFDDSPNYRTVQMLSEKSLFGRTRIAAKEITMIYGVDAAPDRSASPNGHFDAATDGAVTDVQKAEWAHTGGPGRPERPFYGVGAGDAEALCEVGQENLNGYIRTSPYAVG